VVGQQRLSVALVRHHHVVGWVQRKVQEQGCAVVAPGQFVCGGKMRMLDGMHGLNAVSDR
jgi:hypothetical protein